MRNQITAIIKKDIRSITSNHRMFITLLAVPIVLSVVIPSVFILIILFAPSEANEFERLLALLPLSGQAEVSSENIISLVLNYMLPVFFMLIPIMAASVMAACSFVGEKEKRTLETLLYCPLSLKQIFRAKVLAAFLLSMLVSAISFVLMLAVLEAETCLLAGFFILPDAKWLLILLLVAPAISLIAITLIVKASAKAQSVEDAQQGAVFLIFPIIMLLVGQSTGILLLNAWVLLALGVVCAVIAALLLKQSMSSFKYEALLK
ncbi:MAG: ABC transporter permease [Lachnospiraceae bacterium]|nr:ABC transporter permease [Lachnospiraceae bacterium]